MPTTKFPGPCSQCGETDSSGYYKKTLCNNCYRKNRRRERGLKVNGPDAYTGPCVVCGSFESSNGRFAKKMCRACYKRISRDGNVVPQTKYNGPCMKCGLSDPEAKYNRKLCPKCYKHFRNTISGDNARRRAMVKNALNTLTEEQWVMVLEHYDYHCAYCDKYIRDSFTMDHVVPLSKGGAHAIFNVVPACLSCNSGKSDRRLKKMVTVLFPDGSTRMTEA